MPDPTDASQVKPSDAQQPNSTKKTGMPLLLKIILGVVAAVSFACFCIFLFFGESALSRVGSAPAPTVTVQSAIVGKGGTATPTTQPSCADEYEKPIRNDDKKGAKTLIVGRQVVEAGFDSPKDVDWFMMVVKPGNYSVTTFELGSSVATLVTVQDEVGKTLGVNDVDRDIPERAPASRVNFRIDKTTAVYIKIENRWQLGGCGKEYGYQFITGGVEDASLTPTPAPSAAAQRTPAPGATATVRVVDLKIIWDDKSRTAGVINKADGVALRVLTVEQLTQLARAKGLMTANETLSPKAYNTGYVGLEINPGSATWKDTLRVGSLEQCGDQLGRLLQTGFKCAGKLVESDLAGIK